MLSKLIQAGGSKLYDEIHKPILLIWNKKKLPLEWWESIIVPIHKKGDRKNFNNFEGITLLCPSYKILSKVLLSRMHTYTNENIGKYECTPSFIIHTVRELVNK